MLVYIIKTDGGSWAPLENYYATLDKEVAKEIIKDELVYSNHDLDFSQEDVEAFAQALVDGNAHCYYGTIGDIVWCDILELQERKIEETES